MCKQCEINPVYEFTNQRKLCAKCFINYFQKKVLSTIRKFKMVQKGDFVGYKKGNGFREVVLEEVLEMFAERAYVEIVKLPSRKATKIAVSSTIDLSSDKIIQELVKGDINNWKEVSAVDGKVIKPLYLFLDEEVLLYAKLKKLKFKEKKVNKDELSMFIDELEKKHPELKRAVVNSYLELE